MFNPASGTFFTLAGMGLVAAILTAAVIGDTAGAALFLAVSFAGVAAALAVFGAVGTDSPPAVAADSPAPERRSIDRPETTIGSVWPIGLALGLAVMAVGFVLGSGIVFLGLVVAVVVAFGWLAQSWREHPTWTQEMTDRINDRLVVPFGLPATVLLLAGIGIVSFSRILLAVDKNTATLLALVAAMAILGACAFVALRPGLGSRSIGALAGVAVLLVLASGVVGAVKGEREFHSFGGGAEVPEILAVNATEFETTEIVLPAEQEVTVRFNNENEGVPHNVAFYESEGGEPIFRGAIINGPLEIEYEFKTPEPGEYYYQCDVHPSMKGTLIVEEAAVADEGEGHEGSGEGS